MQKTKLSELGTFARGISKHRPRNASELYEGGGYPLVQTGDITNAQFHIESHSQEYNKMGIAQSKIWPKGTLAITIAANIAETGLLSYPMAFPDSVVGFNAYEGKSTNEFVHYLLSFFRKNIKSNVKSTGSIQDNINLQFLNNLELEIPDFPAQVAIAEVLSSIDNKIELNRKTNAELEEISRTIYNYWFIGFNFPDKEGRPYRANGGAMTYSHDLNLDIPSCWKVKKLVELIKTEKSGDWGKEFREGNYTEKVNIIRGADLNSLIDGSEIKAPKRYILPKNLNKMLLPNDMIVEISGGSPTQSTGRIAYITHDVLKRFDVPIVPSNFTKAISLNSDELFEFFYLTWKNYYDSGAFFRFEGKTSGIKNLLFSQAVNGIKIPVPDSKTLTTFTNQVRPLYIQIQQNNQESTELMQLRDWLLPLLMNGQVVVNDL